MEHEEFTERGAYCASIFHALRSLQGHRRMNSRGILETSANQALNRHSRRLDLHLRKNSRLNSSWTTRSGSPALHPVLTRDRAREWISRRVDGTPSVPGNTDGRRTSDIWRTRSAMLRYHTVLKVRRQRTRTFAIIVHQESVAMKF